VPGANDGILSATSLAIGVAAASVAEGLIILATSAGAVSGAFMKYLYLRYDCHFNVSVDWVFIWSEPAIAL
jgi:hypothetical protein